MLRDKLFHVEEMTVSAFCVCLCVCVYIYIHIHTHTYTHTQVVEGVNSNAGYRVYALYN